MVTEKELILLQEELSNLSAAVEELRRVQSIKVEPLSEDWAHARLLKMQSEISNLDVRICELEEIGNRIVHMRIPDLTFKASNVFENMDKRTRELEEYVKKLNEDIKNGR